MVRLQNQRDSPVAVDPVAVEPVVAVEPAAVTTAKETRVRAKLPRQAASSSTIRDRDFQLRPHPRPADILSTVPGLYVVQHSGGGKANQYFLRGFDADHGTDVAIMVDGVPVNLVSHGHGQGYTDINWIIPETIQRLEVKKGPYFTDIGDFGTAGAVNMVSRSQLEQNMVTTTLGGFATPTFFDSPTLAYRGLIMVSPVLLGLSPMLAGEVSYTDGPFANPERYLRFNLFAKVPLDLADGSRLVITGTSYGGGWNGSGQLPLREVSARRLDRFNTIDPTEGGASQRHSLYAKYDSPASEFGQVSVLAYFAQLRFTLFSNFTFFSGDPVYGDQIEQTDVRTYGGADGRYRISREASGLTFDTEAGMQLRSDCKHATHPAACPRRIGRCEQYRH
jgi:outer membrane receptor protein involved in Fe transport